MRFMHSRDTEEYERRISLLGSTDKYMAQCGQGISDKWSVVELMRLRGPKKTTGKWQV